MYLCNKNVIKVILVQRRSRPSPARHTPRWPGSWPSSGATWRRCRAPTCSGLSWPPWPPSASSSACCRGAPVVAPARPPRRNPSPRRPRTRRPPRRRPPRVPRRRWRPGPRPWRGGRRWSGAPGGGSDVARARLLDLAVASGRPWMPLDGFFFFRTPQKNLRFRSCCRRA